MPRSSRTFDWNDVPLLLALARGGTMRAAARHAGVDTSTISRRLAAVESRLGTRLFIRRAEGYVPTDAGHAFLASAETVEGGMQALASVTQTEADRVSGPVRVTSVDIALTDWLVPRLPTLLDRYPQLQLSLIPDNQNLSFTRNEADIALRLSRPQEDAALLMRRVGSAAVAVYGIAAFQRTPREHWNRLPWLALGEDLAGVPEMKWMKRQLPDVTPRLHCNSVRGLLRACEAGLGVSLLPCFAVKTPTLAPLGAPELRRELWLLIHRDLARIRRFRVVADWIASEAKTRADWLAGST